MRLAWSCLVLALACTPPQEREGVTETGNPELTAGVTLRARSTDPDTVSVRGEGDVDVDHLWMAVTEVQLRPRRSCEDTDAESFVPAFVADATAVVPQVQEGRTEATVYCGARVGLDPAADPGDGPPEVEGASLVMTGTSAEGRPFRLRTDMPFTIPLSRDEGNFLVDEQRDRLTIGIDVSVWLDEIWVDDAVPDSDGTIRIEPGSNVELLQEFEAALLDAMDLDIDEG